MAPVLASLKGNRMSLEPPEMHAPHGVKRERRIHWLELLISLSALVVSGVSIGVAIHHGKIMEQLVAANSVPYLEIGSANAVPDASGDFFPALRMDLRNVGVGPADVRNVRVLVEGRSVANFQQWMGQCCTDPAEAQSHRSTLSAVLNQTSRHFIPAGEDAMLFMVRRTDANVAAWQAADGVRQRTTVEACYCSVFDECWIVRSDEEDREEVDACVATEDRFIP